MAIPVQTKQMHHVGNVMEDIAMSMRSEDFAHIASVLNNLYSDPIAAVVREYSTNAWDSHVMAGIDRPIEVTLPTDDNLVFTVQDFGLGLNVDDLRNIYAMYGASDKRHTNDVAGMLGLGSKSGLSYAEAFTIVAVKGGVKTVAMSTKDEHGVGVIKVLDTCGTDEPNGVRITMPVERYDVRDFRNASANFFQFWAPGTVLIDGEPPAVPEWRDTALALDEWDHTLLVRPDAGLNRSYVVMGNVGYPVPDAEIGNGVRHRFVAILNISDVSIPPSREEVQFTPHTKATLSALTDYIATTYKRALRNALDSVSSRWEETMLRVLWMDRNTSLTTSADKPIWNYDPTRYGKKAKSHLRYRLQNLAMGRYVVVTGFPSKTLSAAARDRLEEFTTNQGIKSPTFVVLPTGTNGAVSLDGRPNTFRWDDIVAATAAPAVNGVKVKRPKVETRYAILGGPAMTADELAAVSGKVLYLDPGGYAGSGDLGATVVQLRSSNQIDRLRRFVPGIEHYSEEVDRLRKAAAAAVTDHDRAILAARHLPEWASKLRPSEVIDPDLAQALRLHKTPDTQTILAARTYGADLSVKHNWTQVFNKRYPLLAQVYAYRLRDAKDEILLYINSKYPSVAAGLSS